MTGTALFVSGHEVSQKTKLFLKVREIKGIKQVLSQVEMMSAVEREEWIEEYGDMINDAIDRFVSDSQFSLENIFTDDEVLYLSQELVTTLKETIQTVEGMLYTQAQLES